jgi:hypothetical protein
LQSILIRLVAFVFAATIFILFGADVLAVLRCDDGEGESASGGSLWISSSKQQKLSPVHLGVASFESSSAAKSAVEASTFKTHNRDGPPDEIYYLME